MHSRFSALYNKITLAQQFMLVSLVILVVSMLGLGWWVGKQIEIGVVNRIGAEKALYVNSFIHPILENYNPDAGLSPQDIAILDRLIQETPLAQNVVSFKIWDLNGKVIYSTFPDVRGRAFPINHHLARAMRGEVVAIISDLSKPEDFVERQNWTTLLETYSPVTRSSTTQITAVVEFYQTLDALQEEIARARMSSWLAFGIFTLAIYFMQAFFVYKTSNTIHLQGLELKEKVDRLTDLLNQNEELHNRVKQASFRSASLNERFLRRISADLHDGPAQDLGYALLRIDGIKSMLADCNEDSRAPGDGLTRIKEIESSLQHALVEIRAISAGMGLPELTELTLEQTLTRVIRSHEQRTGTQVTSSFSGSPRSAPLSTKIITYRLVQEALNNSFRHAQGKDLQVKASWDDQGLSITVSDRGPGFDVNEKIAADYHLGILGMLDRAASIDGHVEIESQPGAGTTVHAFIPFHTGDETNGVYQNSGRG